MNKTLGGILLVAGTAIGAGMLAMPITTGFGGFFPTLLLLVVYWLYMMFTALLYLEVNLSIPGENNLITMAKKTLGEPGRIVSWIVYLFLLYSLTAAYISGSTPLFALGLKSLVGIDMPSWAGPLPLLVIFAFFVYLGTKTVDYVNRLLMLGLVAMYLVLAALLPSHATKENLFHTDFPAMLVSVPVILTSFGFHIIIPSLSSYMKHDRKALIKAIVIGSFIAFVVYVIWEMLTLGAIPLTTLATSYKQGGSIAGPLMNITGSAWISTSSALFAFFAILTSFLGVSLSLSDFLSDGFKIKRTNRGRVISCLLTFVPPLGFITLYPNGFIIALQYAGLFVAILLGILPVLMAWKLPKPNAYRTLFGRIFLVLALLLSFFSILIEVLQEKNFLAELIQKYMA